jgi:ferredoxin-NADP reductase
VCPSDAPSCSPGPRGATSSSASAARVPAPKAGKSTLKLELARVTEQTHDAKTLRFRLPDGVPFEFKPGQFLTFDWTVDGRRVVRSYSICSSPAQGRYVEVTVKRVPGGQVSVFANERAPVGLAIDARGPSGKFVFDPARHSRVVLVAGGSGITPMMAILRAIDDWCLPTDVTLLYAVRTERDVIFDRELRELERRLANFRLVVAPSRPEGEWSGPSGRITRELFEAHVADPASAYFFLCGPRPFMAAAREILAAMGVADDRILEERFGGPAATADDAPTDAAVEGRARFAASGVECDIPKGRSLLEVAEMNGVPIPSSCRQGQCGTCATRLVDGEVVMDAEDGLDPEARARGFVLTCVGRARGDVTLDA